MEIKSREIGGPLALDQDAPIPAVNAIEGDGELDDSILEAAYGGPVDLVAHSHPRVLAPHTERDEGPS